MSKKSNKGKSNGAALFPEASILIEFYGDRTEVKVEGCEKLNPRKIQRSFGLIFREWNIFRRQALHEHRLKEEKSKLVEQRLNKDKQEIDDARS